MKVALPSKDASKAIVKSSDLLVENGERGAHYLHRARSLVKIRRQLHRSLAFITLTCESLFRVLLLVLTCSAQAQLAFNDVQVLVSRAHVQQERAGVLEACDFGGDVGVDVDLVAHGLSKEDKLHDTVELHFAIYSLFLIVHWCVAGGELMLEFVSHHAHLELHVFSLHRQVSLRFLLLLDGGSELTLPARIRVAHSLAQSLVRLLVT
mmetsp:Transcript_16334/g.54696  ORF Transcript_16334/g.54696 Transcript_16334/m.54696 type:complete len:208 (+) Transcript_16334:359-982(+)